MSKFLIIISSVMIISTLLILLGVIEITDTSSIYTKLIAGVSITITDFYNLLNFSNIYNSAMSAISVLTLLAGFALKRDELVYFGVITFILGLVGLINPITNVLSTITGGEILANVTSGIINFIIAWSAIEWLRGGN